VEIACLLVCLSLNCLSLIVLCSIHPDTSGHPHNILMHEKFIEWVNGHEGVEWVPMYQMARTFKEMYPTKEDWLKAEEARDISM
jgi:hypothetical protein